MSRALVLGGGGVAGIAWETGLLLGLRDAGVDVTNADCVIGTSAGSAVAAQVTCGVPLAELFARQVSPDGMKHEIAAEFDAEAMMAEWGKILADVAPGVAMYRAIGEYALRASTVDEPVRRDVIAARLPSRSWPKQDLRITVVDAESGEPAVFTKADGVELVDAVAASCAVPGVWPPVTINGHRYIDGGMRSSSNADLAVGFDEVLVISPMMDLPMLAPEVKDAIAKLETTSTVLTIRADEASVAAMGMNPLDPATARPSAEPAVRKRVHTLPRSLLCGGHN